MNIFAKILIWVLLIPNAVYDLLFFKKRIIWGHFVALVVVFILGVITATLWGYSQRVDIAAAQIATTYTEAQLKAAVDSVKNVKAKECVDLRGNTVRLTADASTITKYITTDGVELIPTTQCK